MANDDALDEAGRELGMDREEIEKVLRSHKKHKSRLKQLRKKLRQRAVNARNLKEAKEKYPNRCFCKEEGDDPQHDPDKDKVIRHETRKVWNWYNEETDETYQKPIYRCRRCGKEWEEIIAIG